MYFIFISHLHEFTPHPSLPPQWVKWPRRRSRSQAFSNDKNSLCALSTDSRTSEGRDSFFKRSAEKSERGSSQKFDL
jgi:hypothetical protein